MVSNSFLSSHRMGVYPGPERSLAQGPLYHSGYGAAGAL